MEEVQTEFRIGGLWYKITILFLWGLRCALEYPLRCVLAIVNCGCGVRVPPADNAILLLPAWRLALKIRKREISSEEAVRAYIERIEQVEGVINAVVDERFAEAVSEAREVDRRVRSGHMTEQEMADALPLLGVPFTAKEAVPIKGMSMTGGLVRRKGVVAAADSEAVRRMRAAGAIPLALTNTSELCMAWETYNNVYGWTSNPYDSSRTVGGSSGGEAALISSAGSVIGIGTDLGGSIRMPCFYTGIFGHKPTQNMVPVEGLYPPMGHEVTPYAVVGPMTRYASDLKLVLSTLLGKDLTRQLRLNEPLDIRSLKVYYMLNDGETFTSPVSSEVTEAVKKAIQVLSIDGIVVQKVNLKKIKFGQFIWTGFLSTITEQRIPKMLLGDMDTPNTEPYGIYQLLQWLVRRSDYTFSVVLNAALSELGTPLKKLMDHFMSMGHQLKAELLDLLEQEPSVFVLPTLPMTAKRHGQMQGTMLNINYCVVFNALGLPVTQCPLGLSPSSGLPVGMQIVTAPGNDRWSIELAQYLETKFGGWKPPYTQPTCPRSTSESIKGALKAITEIIQKESGIVS